MADLCFKGPFHFDHLSDLSKISNSGITKAGIYIWGFAFNLNEDKELNSPVNFFNVENFPNSKLTQTDCNKPNFEFGYDFQSLGYKFIPYYVGLKSGKIVDRINEHHKINCGDRLKFTRLTWETYKSFFKNGNFPTLTKNSKLKNQNEIINYIKREKNNGLIPLEYFNNDLVLGEIYNPDIIVNKIVSGIRVDYPYNVQKRLNGNPIIDKTSKNSTTFDSLDRIVNNYNNFWFCYAELENPNTDAEAQVYNSLKGKTISETKLFSNLKIKHSIKPSLTCEDIFKHDKVDNKGNIVCNDKFNGYLDNNPY